MKAASSVAVVGAGVAGCAAAIGLKLLGLEVTLFEAVAEPQPIGAGLLLQPTGQQVLAHLGLLQTALDHGAELDGLLGDTAEGEVVLDMSYHRHTPGAFGLGLQRGVLMGLLWQRVRELDIPWHCGVPVRAFKQNAQAVELRGESGLDLGRFDALIVADGSFSQLRRLMPVKQQADTFPWGALWTVLPMPPEFSDIELRQRFRAGRQMLGLMPVGRTWGSPPGEWPGVNLFWSLPQADMPKLERLDLEAWKRPLVELFPDCAPLLAGLKSPQQLRPARYADVRMERWHHGRVLAIGDCGHGMSPQLGQGANMALIDAQVLARCWKTARGEGWPAVLARYSQERRAHLRFYGQASRALTPLFQSHQAVAPWLRDRLFGPLGRIPWMHGQNVAVLSGQKTGWLWGRLDLTDNPWTSA